MDLATNVNAQKAGIYIIFKCETKMFPEFNYTDLTSILIRRKVG